ncbi:MAG: hypothetical protein K6F80_04440 [Oscillospiraceae bacterium]|nr:hypothetical protein [Oscillospiraceae bacterium]
MYLASFTFTVTVLPVLLLCYYFIPGKGKNVFLLLCSLLIYGWGNPQRLLYLFAVICYDYSMGLLLERSREKRTLSCFLLGLSAVIQVIALVYVRSFKTGGDHVFPFGFALYSLQGLGYLIGVFRGRHPAAFNFINLSLYMAFFPILYVGPLLNYTEFEEQLSHRQCNITHLGGGLTLFIEGLAEKVVLADTFGYIFRELRQTHQLSLLTAWLTVICFTMYLYFELLGYTEMARGLGLAFGFELPRNFDHPFFTPSITAFMQSYHITLVLWFQTHFRYFLFGDNPGSRWKKYGSVILTWLLIGAWYGQKPQFILWGLAIGLLLTLDQLVLQPLTKRRYVVGMLYTAALLQFAWVLFFVDDLSEVWTIWKAMLGFGSGIADRYGLYYFTSYIALILLGLYIAADLFRNISERFVNTAPGRFLNLWKPLGSGLLLVFCLASMLYGERIAGLWLRL